MGKNTSLLVYPHKTDQICSTLSTFHLKDPDHFIFDYFKNKNWIRELGDCEIASLSFHSAEVRNLYQAGKDITPFVPEAISDYIAKNSLYK